MELENRLMRIEVDQEISGRQSAVLWALLPLLLARSGGPISGEELATLRGGGGDLTYPRPGSDDATGRGTADSVIAYLMFAEGRGRGLIEPDVRPSGDPRQGCWQARALESAEADARWRERYREATGEVAP